jgi:hypothetical protein
MCTYLYLFLRQNSEGGGRADTGVAGSGMVADYAKTESVRPEMWGEYQPEQSETDQLAQCFEYEWTQALSTMMRHWAVPPTWY